MVPEKEISFVTQKVTFVTKNRTGGNMVYLNEKQFKVVMVKLFQAVGKKYQSISKSCKGDDWFMKYSWSRKEEKEFKVWLTNYLVKTLNIPILLANKKAEMFIFQYGWKYKEED